jgi:hypothetical protein
MPSGSTSAARAPADASVRPRRSNRDEAEWRRCGSEEEAGAEELAKEGMPNQVLQRSARSEILQVEPVLHARPLNTSLDGSEVIEVKRSGAGGESKKRPGGGVG